MKIDGLKRAILLARRANVTPWIWGHRGLGKSSIVKQVALDNKLGCIDMRLSQVEASDIRGLPDKVNGRTVFLPPADMPYGGMSWEEFAKELGVAPVKTKKDEASLWDVPQMVEELKAQGEFRKAQELLNKWVLNQPRLDAGILFLDELNRAQDDVIQAVFQLVLEGRVGQYVLPPGWSIVVAGNFMEGYQTNGFNDPAFLDRFSHITFSSGEETLGDWVSFMTDRYEDLAANVIEFASHNTKHLDGNVSGDMGFAIEPSRRSWEAVVRVLGTYKDNVDGDDAKLAVIAGLIGRELATSFFKYNCPVKPRDLVEKGVANLADQLKGLDRSQMTGLMWGFAGLVRGKVDDDKYGVPAIDFVEFMAKAGRDKDIATAFCNMIVQGTNGQNRDIKTSMLTNPSIANLVKKFAPQGKTFIHRLSSRPALQEIVSKMTWGEG
jgi:MoxR-like ATPase